MMTHDVSEYDVVDDVRDVSVRCTLHDEAKQRWTHVHSVLSGSSSTTALTASSSSRHRHTKTQTDRETVSSLLQRARSVHAAAASAVTAACVVYSTAPVYHGCGSTLTRLIEWLLAGLPYRNSVCCLSALSEQT